MQPGVAAPGVAHSSVGRLMSDIRTILGFFGRFLPGFVAGEFAPFRFSRRGKFDISTSRPRALSNDRQVGKRPFCRFWLVSLRKLNLDRDEARRRNRETWSR